MSRKTLMVMLLAAVLASTAWLLWLLGDGSSVLETTAQGVVLSSTEALRSLPAGGTGLPAARLQPVPTGIELAEAHEATTSAVLSGVVSRSDDGRLLAGIDVAFELDAPGSPRAQGQQLQAVTDDAGRYTLELPAPCFLENYIIDVGPVSTHTWGLLDRDVLPGEHIELDFQVAVGAELRGRVVDQAGSPIRDAQVRGWITADLDSRAAPSTWGEADRTARSDAAGNFTLFHLGPEFMVDAQAPGMLCNRRLAGEANSGVLEGDLTLVLRPSRELTVSVVDPGGAPITSSGNADALAIDAEPIPDFLQPGEEITAVPGVFRTTAARVAAELDAFGEARLTLDGSPWRVSVDHPDYPLFERAHEPGDENPLRIVLGRGANLEVRVRDVTGRPVAGAEVVCGPLDQVDHRREVTTNVHGRARLVDVDAGYVQVSVRADGFAWAQVGSWGLVSGETRPLEVTLEQSAVLRLRVVDADSHPVPDVTVQVEGSHAAAQGFGTQATRDVYSATSDAMGRIALTPLRTGLHVVKLRSPTSGPRFGLDVALEANGVEQVVVMDARQRVLLRGVVRDALSGEPVPQFTLAINQIVTGDRMGPTLWNFEDAQGQWSLEQMAGATLRLNVSADGYAPASQAPFEVLPEHPPFDISLFTPRSLEIRVRDVQGRPVSARIHFAAPDGDVVRASDGSFYGARFLFTGEDGTLRANGLPAMRLEVQVTSLSLGVEQVEEVDLTYPTDTPLEITVRAGAQRDVSFVVLGAAHPLTPAGSPWEVLARHGRDVLWPIDQRVVMRVLRADDSLVNEFRFSAAEAGAHQAFAPRRPDISWAMPTVELPAEPLRLELSAEGHETTTIRWQPGGPGVVAQDTLVIVLPRS